METSTPPPPPPPPRSSGPDSHAERDICCSRLVFGELYAIHDNRSMTYRYSSEVRLENKLRVMRCKALKARSLQEWGRESVNSSSKKKKKKKKKKKNVDLCMCLQLFPLLVRSLYLVSCTSFKGELNPEMKLSQSIELFVTERLSPIRSLSDVWFSSCASWNRRQRRLNSAATHPFDVIDTAIDREKIRKRWFSELFEKCQHFQAASFQQAFVGPFYASNDGFWKL